MPRLDRLWYDLELRASQYERGLLAAGKSTDKFTKFVKRNKIAVVGAFAVVLALIGTKAVKDFAKFDDAMTKSLAIMGDVSKVMRKDMSDAARFVGRTTSFSATQAGEAFFFLASAGLTAEQSLNALPTVAAFAQAGMFNLALATDLLTDAQSALGLTSTNTAENMENMARVSDVLVKANTLANATVEQFSRALTTKAGAALKIVNKDLEEGVAVLAAFADQGIKGEIAGTRLEIVMRDMQTKAIQNKEAFRSFNIEIFDGSGKMNNMADILEDLEIALFDMSDEEKKATLLTLGFSDRSISATQSLLGLSDKIRQYEKDLRAAGGITATVAGKNLASLKEQVGLLISEFADLSITIGQALAPAVGSVVQLMRDLISIARGEPGDVLRAFALTAIENLSKVDAAILKSGDGLQRLHDAVGEQFAGPAGENVMDRLRKFSDDQLRVILEGTQLVVTAAEAGSQIQTVALARMVAVLEILKARQGELKFIDTSGQGGAVAGGGEPEVVLSEEQVSLIQKAQDVIEAGTVTLIDNAKRALAKFADEVVAQGLVMNETIEKALETLRDNIEALEISEPIISEMEEISRTLADNFDEEGMADATRGLIALQEQLEGVLSGDKLAPDSNARKKIEKLLQSVQDKREEIADDFFDLKEDEDKLESKLHKKRLKEIAERKKAEAEASKDRQQNMRNLVQDLNSAISAALNLAKAFGSVSDATAATLQNVFNLGAGIARIASGDIAGGALQGIAGITGIVGGLFGESKGDKIQRENTRAIQELTKSIDKQRGVFATRTGTELIELEAELRDIVRQLIALGVASDKAIGLDLGRETLDLLESLGIVFEQETKPTLFELQQALEALGALDLQKAFSDFRGQVELLRLEMDLFDITDPLDELTRMREIFLEFTNLPAALQKEIAGLDLTKAEDRARFEAIIQQLFTEFRTTGIGPFGDLTVDQFLGFLRDLESTIDDIGDESSEGRRTQQAVVGRALTETSAGRISSLLTTGVFWQAKTALAAERLVQLFGGGTGVVVTPPRISTMIETNITVHVNINVGGGIDRDNAEEIGELIGTRAGETLDAVLGDRIRESARTVGDVSLN